MPRHHVMTIAVWAIAAFAVVLRVGHPQAPVAASAAASRAPTLDRLYSLPRLIGTAPRGFAWSGDSKRLAFLWNDEGTNFYDVWMLTVAAPTPVRVTRMPRPAPGAHTTTDA